MRGPNPTQSIESSVQIPKFDIDNDSAAKFDLKNEKKERRRKASEAKVDKVEISIQQTDSRQTEDYYKMRDLYHRVTG